MVSCLNYQGLQTGNQGHVQSLRWLLQLRAGSKRHFKETVREKTPIKTPNTLKTEKTGIISEKKMKPAKSFSWFTVKTTQFARPRQTEFAIAREFYSKGWMTNNNRRDTSSQLYNHDTAFTQKHRLSYKSQGHLVCSLAFRYSIWFRNSKNFGESDSYNRRFDMSNQQELPRRKWTSDKHKYTLTRAGLFLIERKPPQATENIRGVCENEL